MGHCVGHTVGGTVGEALGVAHCGWHWMHCGLHIVGCTGWVGRFVWHWVVWHCGQCPGHDALGWWQGQHLLLAVGHSHLQASMGPWCRTMQLDGCKRCAAAWWLPAVGVGVSQRPDAPLRPHPCMQLLAAGKAARCLSLPTSLPK